MSQKNKDDKEKRFFNPFFRLELDGPGVEKGEDAVLDKPTFKNFFKLLWRKLNQLVSLNIFTILGNFPIFFILLVIAGFFSTSSSAPSSPVFAPLSGVISIGGQHSAALNGLVGIYGAHTAITVLSSTDYILLGLSALLAITFGPVMTGSTYIARGFVREEPVFMFHDFFYAIKRNIKQAIPFGILDLGIILIIIYDIVFFNMNYGENIGTTMLFFGALCLAAMYFMMRSYIYLMMITFDLKITKMLKNALIFTVLGVKRNIAMLLGSLFVVLLNIFLLLLYPPVGIILPFVIVPSMLIYISVYCEYPVVKKIMIDPYYKDKQESE